ncbi:hypothetical protein B0T18DRAFT_16133 [Schizothecium vesticola]|uniref:Uncharacterized protein n=1 Tax=Schizothecium vesticola TaxID=314040 RepID=A0AA40KC78_9PEZI|nr:hypothetical protein B0T18DRAFT_16133 [Schizothecium vesticola]
MDEPRPYAKPGTLTTIGTGMPPPRACEAAQDAMIGRTGQDRCQRLMRPTARWWVPRWWCGGGREHLRGALPAQGPCRPPGRFKFGPIRDSGKPSLGGLGDATTRPPSFPTCQLAAPASCWRGSWPPSVSLQAPRRPVEEDDGLAQGIGGRDGRGRLGGWSFASGGEETDERTERYELAEHPEHPDLSGPRIRQELAAINGPLGGRRTRIGGGGA